jgi:hypothetical protein
MTRERRPRQYSRFGVASPPMSAWLLGLCAIGLASCDIVGDDMAANPRPFAAEEWRADLGNDRCDMVGDLVGRIKLVGRSRTELEDMLGVPDSSSGGSDFYHLCPSFMDIYVLEIRWQDDKVGIARIRDT